MAQRAMKKITSGDRTPESIEMTTITKISSSVVRTGPLQPLQALVKTQHLKSPELLCLCNLIIPAILNYFYA